MIVNYSISCCRYIIVFPNMPEVPRLFTIAGGCRNHFRIIGALLAAIDGRLTPIQHDPWPRRSHLQLIAALAFDGGDE